MAITFQSQDTDSNPIGFKLQDSTKIKSWIKKIIESEKKKTGQLNFVFTSDEELLKTNIQFLNHSTYTDIITFDSCEGETVNGDIIISIERVAENAHKFKVDFKQELKRVIIHGVLHLCGYKDKTNAQAKIIRAKEDEALKKFS
jgi:probable rRNA maturation factor